MRAADMQSTSCRSVFKGCRAVMASATATARTESAPTSSSSSKKAPAPAGILKAVPISPALSKFVGAPQVSRTEAVKKIWVYIKANNLQNPENKRNVKCDEKLKTIFEGRDEVSFLEIAKLLSGHFVKDAKVL